MSGAGLQLTRGRRGEDNLFCSVRARRAHLSLRIDQLHRSRSDVSTGRSTNSEERPMASMNSERENQPESHKFVPCPASEQVALPSNNLERFLESVTPFVPAQYLSKTTLSERRTYDAEPQPYFLLEDVWESFAEWSAYGTGVPLILNNRDRVVQYYVPYLSAIQIYADSHALNSSLESRRLGVESDSDFRDSSSDGNSDSEPEQGFCYLRDQIFARMDRMSLRERPQEDSSSDDGESLNSRGRLIFEYLERDLPYIREPLADKVSDLASRFPELKTLRSCDLLPSSWFSVAWYPIYRIPTGPTLKHLDACFLTYHLLHTPVGGQGLERPPITLQPSEIEGVQKMPLPVFGLASYKFRGSLWTPNGGTEHQLVNSLFQAADNWLRLREVNHPDFLFFCRR